LCEGPIAEVRRIWADGEEIDQSLFNIRVYRGDEEQVVDPLIAAKEGSIGAPAYKGTAYVVFERMPLADFGNRIPQFSFEVVKPISGQNDHIRAVCIIPGSTEFAYEPRSVMASQGSGISSSENRHVLFNESDWAASIDSLQNLCPKLKSVALVVSWFGDDLRAGECSIAPRCEKSSKTLLGFNWAVAGMTRSSAQAVTTYDGKPAYGGTPSDASVIAAIQDLKSRGLEVVFYPFVMMDIDGANSLVDPWAGTASQPAYPWRGRITCHPAPGRVGTPDGSGVAASQVASFFGSASPNQTEWSYRRFILHCADLCVQAGGGDAFLVGSELRGLTRVRAASGVYPAVNALSALASDVKSILGSQTKVSYAADWTEYGTHVLDGGAEVRFPLDALWASPSIDFVGIDSYWPLSDWRDGETHLDRPTARSIYDLDYLSNNMSAGEYFDWHYADENARFQQSRSAITDGAYGKPWVFRAKDVKGWWGNFHYERVSGNELSSPTPWVPASKPVWFMEAGCPAVDRGTNAPHVFPDEKSSESRLPWHSRGHRDDLIQSRALEAFAAHFDPASVHYIEGNNPLSPHYTGRMVDLDRLHFWAWDARPFPAFPQQGNVWADASAWFSGHWMNGRLEAIALDRLLPALTQGVLKNVDPFERPPVDGMADGFVIETPTSPRAAIEPLSAFFGFETVSTDGRLNFVHAGQAHGLQLSKEELVPLREGALYEITRSQESELPRQIAFSIYDGEVDYRTCTVVARHGQSGSLRERSVDVPLVTSKAEAQRRAEILLNVLWNGRDEISLSTSPSRIEAEVGDTISLEVEGSDHQFLITRIVDAEAREFSGRLLTESFLDHPPPMLAPRKVKPPAIAGPPKVEILELAVARTDPPTLQHVAIFSDPWPGRMAIWRKLGSDSFVLRGFADKPAIIGETQSSFMPSPPARFDRRNTLIVHVGRGVLSSQDEVSVFAGRNLFALKHAGVGWEICAFANAELIASNTWRLSHFIRGLGGEEYLCEEPVDSGATFVLLDDAVIPLSTEVSDIGQQHVYRIGPADHDHSAQSYTQVETSAGFLALKPYTPVRAVARRTPSGIEISFLRRGRLESDSWEPVDIRLGEEREFYEADIFDGTSLLRTLRASSSDLLYAATDEISDFSSLQSHLDIAIYQNSVVAGRGYPLRTIVQVN
jgi:hypothetical protein